MVPPIPGRAQQVSTRLAFLVAGFGLSAWAPLVPFAKARAQLDDGTLGLLLLCLGTGSLLAMPFAGALAARFGCRVVIGAATLVMGSALPFLATLSTLPGLAASLLIFGMGVGCLDVVINVQAVIVEKAAGHTLMSGFHGMFSLGGIVGSAGVAALLGLGVRPLPAVAVVLALIVGAFGVAAPSLLPYGSSDGGPLFAVPRGFVLFLGVLCTVLFLAEGTVLDWSAVFLSSNAGLPKERAGLGYAAFALTMTVGRLTGDGIVHRLGAVRIVRLGGACAAVGMGLTLVPAWPVVLAGYALVGAGLSNLVPVLFSAAGRQTAVPENVAVPAITTLGYAGVLAAPAAIGFVSQRASLSVAFALVTLLLIGVAGSAPFLRDGAGQD